MSFCLVGLALALAWRRRLRGSMALAALAFVWLWAWSMPMLSGGYDPERHAYSEARAMAAFMADLGVPAQANQAALIEEWKSWQI